MPHLTPDDIAADLKVSRETAMRHLRDGRIPGHKVGRVWRVEAEVYAEWARQDSRPDDPFRIEPRSARGEANLRRAAS